MLKPQIREMVLKCKVPNYMENDKWEPYTQKEFTKYLLVSVEKIGLVKDEIESILNGTISKTELYTIINGGRN